MKPVALNRKAEHNYFVYDRYEAGIVLIGTEVKSLRQGKVSLTDGYAAIENGEVFLYNVHISPYAQGSIFNKDPKRKRKLLLKKFEIRKLYGKTKERGFTLIPLKIFFNKKGMAKVELGLCKGKKLYDKREELRRRELKREKARLRKWRG